MFGSANQDAHSLFAGIKSNSGTGLFRVTDATSSDKVGTLFTSSTTPSTGLFGLTVTSSPNKVNATSSNEHFAGEAGYRHPSVDFDSPLPENSSTQPSNRSPTHWPALKLSRLPIGLNRKGWLQQYFERFGSVTRVLCQPSLDAAYVAFETVTAAQRAKRHGHDPTADGESLPNSVLLTMAQCRSRNSTSSSSGAAQSTQPMTKRKLSPIKPGFPREQLFKTVKRLSERTGSSAARLDSSPERSGQPPLDTSLPRTLFGCTVEERASVLQAHYQTQRQRRPSPEFQPLESSQLDSSMSEDALDPRAVAIRGSCMDMCPELERYLREVHHRVSVFECLPSTLAASSSTWQMDHTRAVKDYERSSADQPVPLPCELRPAPVLQRTMAYLLASIADRPELDTTRSLWKPWYEFMWTRTRAIRKDIVQQRLCCPIIVGVMERITRFHIFCAARLVDQPIDSFDPRINSENLTQCLQTLKEMYNDLYSAEDDASSSVCPHEAEFRAYMLLMNVNDQGALNDVQKLPPHLLRSPEIRFAVSVHECVNTNNYVRFFRLVHQATFLAACLMHRYFVQVRSQALIRLAASFAGHPRRDVQYPLSTLTRQLGFEDNQEAKAFCECWSLSVFDNQLIFEKQTPPQPPELAWRERRAARLIEQKRAGIPLSTVFNGGPVRSEDAIPLPVHSSFDNEDRFIGTDELVEPVSVDLSTDITQRSTAPSALSSVLSFTPPAPPKPKDPYLLAVLNNKASLVDFVDHWISEQLECRSISHQALVEETVSRSLSSELVEQTIHEEILKLITKALSVARQTVQERATAELRDTLLESILTSECRVIAQNCLALASIHHDLLELEFLPALTQSLVRKCWLSARADQFRQQHLFRTCFRQFYRWIHHKQLVEREHALFRSMPACPPPHQNALSLVGPKLVSGTFLESSADYSCVSLAKRPRFSTWAQEMDNKITWQPVSVGSQPILDSLGLYSPTSAARMRKPLSVITAWLRIKLSNYNLIPIPNLIRSSPSTSKLSGLLCLGYPDEAVLRYSSDNQLPVLAFAPEQLTPEAKQCADSALDPSSVYLMRFSWTGIGQFVPNPSWSIVLQDGLDWLTSCVLTRCITAQSEGPTPRRSSSRRLWDQLGIVTVIWHLVDRLFLHPLATLSRTWKTRGMVTPCPESLFSLYHLTIDRVCSQLHNPQLLLTVQSLLCIPPDLVQLLTSDTWDQFIQSWLVFADQLNLSFCTRWWVQTAITHVERSFRETIGRCGIAPLPILAPWLTLCMATVRDRLEHLTQSDLGASPSKLEPLDRLLELLCESSEEEILENLSSHFSNIGEPRMTYDAAVDLSIDNSSRREITVRLVGSSETANLTASPLLCKLDALRHRMDIFEESMQEVLEETGVSSRLSLSSTHTTLPPVSRA